MKSFQDQQSRIIPKSNQDDKIDLKKFFFLFLNHWYFFILGLILVIGSANLYIRVVLPTYKVKASLLFDESQQNLNMGTDNLMQGFGLRSTRHNLDNQIQILSSWALVKKSLSELPYEVDYYLKGRVNEISLYPNNPILVFTDSSLIHPYGTEFSIYFIDESSFRIYVDKKSTYQLDIQAKYGEIIDGGRFKLRIEKESFIWNSNFIGRTIYFKFKKDDDLIRNYKARLDIIMPTVESTIIELSLSGTNPAKDADFLSKLIEVFIWNNLNKKNFEADRTIKFIDDQLEDISDSLVIAEDRLQDFRSKNRVMDISEKGSRVMEQAIRLEDDRARLMIENDYYKYLNNYLSKDDQSDQVIAPSTMGISDPMIISLVGQLAELQAEYYSLGAGGKNPLQVNLSVRIQNTRKALLETLRGIIRTNDYAINENQTRLRELNRQAESLPVTERKLLGIEREFKLNDALYNFLLQKQAEAQIQKASNSSDTEIIDMPRVLKSPTWPKNNLIYLVAFLIGIGIPSALLIIFDAISFKIENEEDIRKITDLPITGHIFHHKKSYQTVVLENPNSVTAESFRSLRTRLRFFTKEMKSPVILLTSSMPGEGKTFSALNLASAYCLEKKNTVLVGFDLRRPKLFDDFNLKNEIGVSTYLIGSKSLSEIIQQTDNPYLDLISAGPVPPNPAELIASLKTEELIKELKERYDYIIVDSAPIGTLSDSYFLAKLADANLLIVRRKSSLKNLLAKTLLEIKDTGIKEIGIVFNDLVPRKGYYGYGYGVSK